MGLKKNIEGVRSTEMTLKDKVNNKKTDIEKLINTLLGRKPVLPYDLKEEVVSYSLVMERKFWGLTRRSIKRMAFEVAIENGLTRSLSVQQGRAG